MLDDGGHTNIQQISTLANSVNNINDGGIIVVEDTQTSYMKKGFNNPSSGSFINYSKYAIDSMHRRSPILNLQQNNYSNKVYSIYYYESLVAFNIDSSKCGKNKIVSNKKKDIYFSDFRHKGYYIKIFNIVKKNFPYLLNFRIVIFFIKKLSGRNLFYLINKFKILSYFFSIKK